MPYKISTKEALKNSGFNNILEVAFESIIPACCSEGCEVEPDGYCEHGYPSILIYEGLI